MQSGAKRTERPEGAAARPMEGDGREAWSTSLAWLHPPGPWLKLLLEDCCVSSV